MLLILILILILWGASRQGGNILGASDSDSDSDSDSLGGTPARRQHTWCTRGPRPPLSTKIGYNWAECQQFSNFSGKLAAKTHFREKVRTRVGDVNLKIGYTSDPRNGKL